MRISTWISRGATTDVRFGLRYAELSEEEQAQWDGIDWNDVDADGDAQELPVEVNTQAVNQWLFNADTVDKVLGHLMANGLKVAGGERLGKTIVFAKNTAHAEFIAARFNLHYPHLKGEFARVITFKTEYAQSLIDAFSDAAKPPHIAISVDMLDTGIDVPEVLNLVFFKLVRSKTKFWQMVGRGTRLCENLFAPGVHKTEFLIFDFCQNLEYFEQDLPASVGALGESLGSRLFTGRLELLLALDDGVKGFAAPHAGEPPQRWEGHDDASLRRDTAELLRVQVAAMNVDNFLVRPRRRLVELYREAPAWPRCPTSCPPKMRKRSASTCCCCAPSSCCCMPGRASSACASRCSKLRACWPTRPPSRWSRTRWC